MVSNDGATILAGLFAMTASTGVPCCERVGAQLLHLCAWNDCIAPAARPSWTQCWCCMVSSSRGAYPPTLGPTRQRTEHNHLELHRLFTSMPYELRMLRAGHAVNDIGRSTATCEYSVPSGAFQLRPLVLHRCIHLWTTTFAQTQAAPNTA